MRYLLYFLGLCQNRRKMGGGVELRRHEIPHSVGQRRGKNRQRALPAQFRDADHGCKCCTYEEYDDPPSPKIRMSTHKVTVPVPKIRMSRSRLHPHAARPWIHRQQNNPPLSQIPPTPTSRRTSARRIRSRLPKAQSRAFDKRYLPQSCGDNLSA